MSKVQEIQAAILELSPPERDELVRSLPRILPELNGDAIWDRILNEDPPRESFVRYVDQIQADLAANKLELRETSEEEFKRES
jgi:hypothetical protein